MLLSCISILPCKEQVSHTLPSSVRVARKVKLQEILLKLVLWVLGCSEQKDDPDELRIQEEIKQYGDILRLDMVDTYADLSLKTLKMFSILPQKYDADFYFKIDDDVAVNIDAMANYLNAKRNQGNLYLVSRLAESPRCCQQK